jgi:hypothetical protein
VPVVPAFDCSAETSINLKDGGVNRPIVCRRVLFATILDVCFFTGPVREDSDLPVARVELDQHICRVEWLCNNQP